MGRPRRKIYCFISNSIGEYYRVTYDAKGNPVVDKDANPLPLSYNPTNLKSLKIEFGTNRKYNSMHRAVSNPLTFIKDGADILRYLDYLNQGYETIAYFTMIKYNPDRGVFELDYYSRIDFAKKKDNPKTGYTVNTVDNTAWGILSQKDDIKYKINCTASNPKAIKVLFDGINLQSKYIYQDVSHPIDCHGFGGYLYLPLVLIAQDGDASGIIAQSQTLQFSDRSPKNYVIENPANNFFKTMYPATVRIRQTREYVVENNTDVGFSLSWYFWRSTDTVDFPNQLPANRRLHVDSFYGRIAAGGVTRSFDIDQTFNLASGEWLLLVCVVTDFGSALGQETAPYITPKLTNFTVDTQTVTQPTIAYALRPLDVLQDIVKQATNGQFTIDSDFYKINNKVVLTCGDALRNAPVAYIQSSFYDWFKSYDAGDFLAMRIINGNLFVEPNDTVYTQTDDIIDLGEIKDIEVEHATEYLISAIEVGSPVQDYRRSSGRLEFNTTNKFSLDVSYIKNILNLVSVYRRDGYGAEFIRLDYQGGSTKDNSGDTSVFMIAITDNVIAATTLVENFQNINVDITPLAPIITFPINNDIITYPSPRVRGKAPAGQTVNIYVDTVFDGSAVADANGDWSYNIVAALAPYQVSGINIINDGVHVINATFTNMVGDLATTTINIFSGTTPTAITYPTANDSLYDNKPLIKGVAQQGTAVTVTLDGVVLGIVTPDHSCKWEIQSPVILNGAHNLIANTVITNFTVDSSPSVPLITSELDQYILVNNLPLIEGVAIPGTVVKLYLDFYSDVAIGTATADTHGNWSIQLVPLSKIDGTVLTPIPNGVHTISTDTTIKSANVSTYGYELDRPAYTSITGVPDNTVFNTTLSPARMLRARASYFASIMLQKQNTSILYEIGDKNQSLSTTLNGVTIQENADIPIASLGQNMFTPAKMKFNAVPPSTFNKIFNSFNHGGVVRATYTGTELFFLPIGNMSYDDITDGSQTWNLLVSRRTSLMTLLNLSKSGLTVNLMRNAVYHSDLNTLHIVKYNHAIPAKYHNAEIHDDWFNNRNEQWTENPDYIQKHQTTEHIKDQIITNGIADAALKMYRCSDGALVQTFPYASVAPAPIPFPDVVQEVYIDMAAYPEDQYFFVLFAGGQNIGISERIITSADWANTLLFECGNTYNYPGFMFSTGIKSVIRIEGLVQKWSPSLSVITNRDEIGDNQLLHSVNSRKRTILIGNARGLPDYLYLKIAAAVQLNNIFIEGVNYIIDQDNKMEELNRVDGFPMYHYSLEVEMAVNDLALTLPTDGSADFNSVVLVVDADAFGIGGSGLIDIELNG